MFQRTVRFVIAFSVAASAGAALAQYELPWSSLDGGGATAPAASVGGSFEVAGTIGQPDAGPAPSPMLGGSFEVRGGFWAGVSVAVCPLPGDMDLNSLRDGMDTQDFVACLLGGAGPNCLCADLSGNGVVGAEDVDGFVTILLGA